ncbi:abortive infection family protein [Mycobacterium crocinum]|uniref:Abortive infection family protein n=1 Tax=Mycolicibacterium crocinum TaxID=388459 RepID=A0ABY3TFA3_9MYCO|nr:abortive infection family protein [Mycolicibacterium crocinum]MCV7216873.1 abortive infection family protein [Mycolicibacterium crocinum]ULN40138.1 abortive infection family protein [Mycolicibacterium crocinum]
MATNLITQVTRRKIFDTITLSKVLWEGRLHEPDFLARIYDLDSMPSTDSRYKSAAGDIWQHRVNNPEDWPDDWIFTDSRFGLQHGDDELVLRFLAETLHPVVRPDEEEVAGLLRSYNEALARDGYELFPADWISGHAVYGWRRRESFHGSTPELRLRERELLTDPMVLEEHLVRIRDSLASDPAAAISSSKNLVESLFRIILDRSGVKYGQRDDIPQLYRHVAELLELKADSVPESAKGSSTSQQILRTLVTTIQSLAELRNELGIGHGQSTRSVALARHARLALNATVTVAEFVLDTWHARVAAGRLAPLD